MITKRNHLHKRLCLIFAVIIGCSLLFYVPEGEVHAAVKKPAKVTLSSAAASGQSAVILKWKKASRAKGYQVYMNGGHIASVGNVKSYKQTGLSAGTTYSFKVRAFTTYKQKQYYNKKTKKWQKKKPAKKYLGKSRNVTLYKYGSFSRQLKAVTANAPAKPVQPGVITTGDSLVLVSAPKQVNLPKEAVIRKPTNGNITVTSNNRNARATISKDYAADREAKITINSSDNAGSTTFTVTFIPSSGYACTGSKVVSFTVRNTIFPCNPDGSYEVVADWVNLTGHEPTSCGGVWCEFSKILDRLPNGSTIRVNAANMDRSGPLQERGLNDYVGWGRKYIIATSNSSVARIDNDLPICGVLFVGSGEVDLTYQIGQTQKVFHFIVD